MKKIIIICILIFIPFVVNSKELEQEWDLNYGSFAVDSFESIILDQDENNYIIGESYIDNDEIYGWIGYVLKIDKTGKILWKKDYFDEYKIGSSQYNDYILTNDGGILIAGQRTLYNSSGYMDENKYDAILLKYDKDGNKEWETIYGGTGGDYFRNITVTEDNEYIVIGNSDSKDIAGFENKGNNDVIALKFDTKGNIIWKKS